MTQYEIEKEKVREKAIDWQHDLENHNYSYEELAEWRDYFDKLARRYGRIEEFRENGII